MQENSMWKKFDNILSSIIKQYLNDNKVFLSIYIQI